MDKVKFQISSEILNKFPETRIGLSVFQNLNQISDMNLPDKVDSLRRVADKFYGLTTKNVLENPTILRWREVFEDCGVRVKKHKSSVEALTRRFIKNEYRTIHNVVDIYNHVSYGNLLPMGGYDISKIEGEVSLRYSLPGDSFVPLNGAVESVPENLIVYSDQALNDNILCWMWNHKDCRRTMLLPETDVALFIIDSTMKEEHERIQDAQEDLSEILKMMGANEVDRGFIDINRPSIEIKY